MSETHDQIDASEPVPTREERVNALYDALVAVPIPENDDYNAMGRAMLAVFGDAGFRQIPVELVDRLQYQMPLLHLMVLAEISHDQSLTRAFNARNDVAREPVNMPFVMMRLIRAAAESTLRASEGYFQRGVDPARIKKPF